MESLRGPSTAKSSGTVPEGGSRCVYDVLYIIFLLAIVSLSSLILIPRVFETMTYPKETIDQVIKVDEIIPNDPGEVIGPHNEHKYRKTTREPETEDYTEEPLPTVLPKEMKPHPEESDEDDLPLLYHRLNPARTKRVIYRLAEWLRPISYDVALKVGVRGHNGEENSWVKGSATIKFMVVGDASNLLEIHGEFFKDLQLGILEYGTGQELKSIRQFYNWEKRTYSWLLEQPLIDEETYALMLSWKASIGQGVLGLYETWYSDGNMNWYSLTTHGEPMSTRKWMPCFDEPALKATLKLTVTHPSSLQARSNGRIISTQFSDDGKTMTSSFAPTLSISPYLYALSVADYVEMKDTVEGIPISVVVPPPYKSKLNSSLQLAKKSVIAYLSVLKADRIFDKIDFVFVPDHNTAMENVGHITFGISYLDNYATYAHEMIHNYFGNLITLSWWDEVWINDGLTAVYEIDAVCGIGTEAAVKHYRKLRHNVMIQLDSFRKMIPLKFDVRTEVEADVNFQKPYTKGPVVLLMIRNIVGEKAWKTGIENFLDKFKLQAVDGMDFLRTIIGATNENGNSGCNGQTPLLTMMLARSFFENKGFPLLRITRNGRTIEWIQERFHRGFINGNMKDNKQKWAIPIHLMKLDGTPYKTLIMPDQSLSIDVDFDGELVLDPSKIVFYRAVYDKETYSKILTSSLSNAAKNEIVEDLLYAAYSGYVDPPLAYSVFSKRKSSNYLSRVVWDLHTQVTLLHPDRLFATVQIYNNKSKSEFVKWEKARYTVNKTKYCDGIETEADLMTKYAVNRTWECFLCPKTIDSMELQNYKKIIKTGLDLSKPQQLHPMDFERLIFHYNNIISNIVAYVLLEMAPSIEMWDFVLLLAILVCVNHLFKKELKCERMNAGSDKFITLKIAKPIATESEIERSNSIYLRFGKFLFKAYEILVKRIQGIQGQFVDADTIDIERTVKGQDSFGVEALWLFFRYTSGVQLNLKLKQVSKLLSCAFAFKYSQLKSDIEDILITAFSDKKWRAYVINYAATYLRGSAQGAIVINMAGNSFDDIARSKCFPHLKIKGLVALSNAYAKLPECSIFKMLQYVLDWIQKHAKDEQKATNSIINRHKSRLSFDEREKLINKARDNNLQYTITALSHIDEMPPPPPQIDYNMQPRATRMGDGTGSASNESEFSGVSTVPDHHRAVASTPHPYRSSDGRPKPCLRDMRKVDNDENIRRNTSSSRSGSSYSNTSVSSSTSMTGRDNGASWDSSSSASGSQSSYGSQYFYTNDKDNELVLCPTPPSERGESLRPAPYDSVPEARLNSYPNQDSNDLGSMAEPVVIVPAFTPQSQPPMADRPVTSGGERREQQGPPSQRSGSMTNVSLVGPEQRPANTKVAVKLKSLRRIVREMEDLDDNLIIVMSVPPSALDTRPRPRPSHRGPGRSQRSRRGERSSNSR